MNGSDSFFVSQGLENLFETDSKALVIIDGVECDFISYNTKNRVTQFSIQTGNPFVFFENKSSLKITISFGAGHERIVNYSNWSYKIEQSSFGFIITVGDCDE